MFSKKKKKEVARGALTASSITQSLFPMDSKRSPMARAGLHTRRAGPKSMMKSSKIGRRAMPH